MMWWNEILSDEVKRAHEERLVKLRADLDAAHSELRYLGQMNTVGIGPEARIRLDVSYQAAQDKALSAAAAYYKALRNPSSTSSP